MADLLLDVDLPQGVWSRSGRPRRGDVVRWFGALTLILAGLAVPVLVAKLALVVAGLAGFFATPVIVAQRLKKIEEEVARADRKEVPGLLSGLERRRVVALFAPHAWVELQKARLHLKSGDGRAAAHALGECGRMCRDTEHPAILSGQARAFALSGDRKDAREKLMALSKRDAMRPRDHLDLGVVLLGESGRAAKAKEEIERAAEALGDHPQVVAARAVLAARDDELDDAQALLEDCEGRDGIEEDPIAQELIKKARKALRPKLQAAARSAKKAKKAEAGASGASSAKSGKRKAESGRKGRRGKKDKRRERREKRRAAKGKPTGPNATAEKATEKDNAKEAAAKEAAAKEAAAKEAAAKEAAAKEAAEKAAAEKAAAEKAAAEKAAAEKAAAEKAAAEKAAAEKAAAEKAAAAKDAAEKAAAEKAAAEKTASEKAAAADKAPAKNQPRGEVEDWPSTERAEPLASDSGRLPSRAPTLLPDESGSRVASPTSAPSARQTVPPPPRLDLSAKGASKTPTVGGDKEPSKTPTLGLTPKAPSQTPTLGLGGSTEEDNGPETEPAPGTPPSKRTTLPPSDPAKDASSDSGPTPKPPAGKPGSLFNAIGSRTSFFKPPPLPGKPSGDKPKVAPPPVVGAPPKTGAASPGAPDSGSWDDLLGEDSGPSPIAPKPTKDSD